MKINEHNEGIDFDEWKYFLKALCAIIYTLYDQPSAALGVYKLFFPRTLRG